MILNIKAAVRSQIPEITAVFSSYSDEAVPTEFYDGKYLESCIRESLLTAVITCDKTVRGVCVCRPSQIPDGCEIAALYITEGFQRKGFGRKLLSHTLREMRAKHYKTAFLWIDENSADAIRFFRKFGFSPDGKRRRTGELYEQRLRIDI